MSDNKKYYYLKLKDNFFDGEEIIVLESMPDGYLYCNILLKLYLRSLKNEGKLMFNDRIPYNPTVLSQVVRQPVGVVEKALKIFKEFGLIDILDNGAIYMLDVQNLIGKSSSEADRQREYQHRISKDKNNVKRICKKSNMKSNMKSTPELELELDLKLEKETETDLKKTSVAKKLATPICGDIRKILDYLNETTGMHYKLTDAFKRKIHARVNEGFELDDFKKVITKKTTEWKGTPNEKYLRPETLFGNKFDGYLNTQIIEKEQNYTAPCKDFGNGDNVVKL